jgi:calcineurin-like phosphoesterase family protein
MSDVYFTSDTHLGHSNAIRYCDRPWAVREPGGTYPHLKPSELLGRPVKDVDYEELKRTVPVDVDAMDMELTRRWNERVKPGDTVYHIGDVAMGKRDRLPGYRAALNGRIILILGNHDRSKKAMLEAGFDEVYDSLRIEVSGLKLYLSHHPPSPERYGYCDYALCGHVHEAWARKGKVINVGVDVRDFRPVTIEELIATPT